MIQKRMPPWPLRPRTRQVRGGMTRSPFGETSEALFLTSGYVYDSPEEAEAAFKGEQQRFVYSRFGNPTVAMLEDRLAAIEGARLCRATASGMAAVFATLMTSLSAGDRLVSSRALFGSCDYIVTTLLPAYGIETELIDATDLEGWRRALSRPTQCVFLETPSNPNMEIIDLPLVCRLAEGIGARVVVDNVFATPVLQSPLSLGAQVVVYSTTKHIDGQGRCLGGAILTNDETWVNDNLVPFLRNTGPSLSPFNAWVLLKGLETLSLRVTSQSESALEIARWLEHHSGIARMRYPGLPSHPQYPLARRQMSGGGTMISFDVKGDKAEAFQFLNKLQLIDISNNLGDAKSLITHPATTTHQRLTDSDRARLGISGSTLRLSVGLEDPADLIADFEQALA